MNRFARSVIVTMAAMGMTFGVTGSASAATTAYNLKTQELTASPTDGMGNSCKEKRIQLAQGAYDWYQHMGTADALIEDNMQLGAGWYTWSDCLNPQNGWYRHTSTLNPDNPNWGTATRSGPWTLQFSGTYTWGSSLDPRF